MCMKGKNGKQHKTNITFFFFRSLALSSSIRLFVIFYDVFAVFLNFLCSLLSLSLALSFTSLLSLAFYYLLQWSYNVNAIRPRMSRIIYMSFTLLALFLFRIIFRCWPFRVLSCVLCTLQQLIASLSRVCCCTHTHTVQKCCAVD